MSRKTSFLRILRYIKRKIWSAPYVFYPFLRNGFYLANYPDSFRVHSLIPKLSGTFVSFASFNFKNRSDIPRLILFHLNLQRLIESNVEGSFAELGVWRGNLSSVLARYAESSSRRLYLLDTFTGFDPSDLQGIDKGQQQLFQDTSISKVKSLVASDYHNIAYIKGHFPDSITDELRSDTYAFVSIDCDLYEPISQALEFFYPRLSKRGLILVHDYSSGYWPGATMAVDEFCNKHNLQVVLMPDKSGTAAIVKSLY